MNEASFEPPLFNRHLIQVTLNKRARLALCRTFVDTEIVGFSSLKGTTTFCRSSVELLFKFPPLICLFIQPNLVAVNSNPRKSISEIVEYCFDSENKSIIHTLTHRDQISSLEPVLL